MVKKPTPITSGMIQPAKKGAAAAAVGVPQRGNTEQSQTLHPFHSKMPQDFIDRWEDFAYRHGRLKRPQMLRAALHVLERMPEAELQQLLAEVSRK